MRNKIAGLLVIVFALLSGTELRAEWPFFRFDHYTVEDGLSVNTVTSIVQDSRGFMWFGTGMGLNSYDGRTFRNFVPQDKNDSTRRINEVQCLAEGFRGELLVGTIAGLYVFDPQLEEFSFFGAGAQDGTTIGSPVYSTALSSDGILWIATRGQGIFSYDYSSSSLRHWCSEPSKPESIPSDNVRNIYIDRRNCVWVLTFDAGICCLNPEDGTCRRYSDWDNSYSNRYDVMLEDSNGRLWLGNYSKGLACLDPESGRFEHYLLPSDRNHLHHIRAIIEYSPSILLLASDDGLGCFDPSTAESTILRQSTSDITGLNDSYVHSLFIDNEGSLWVGTYFGGINYSPFSADDFRHWCPSSSRRWFPGRIVSVIRQDNRGDLWIGTDDAGVVRFNPQRGGVLAHYMPGSDVNSLAYQNIHALLCDRDDVWIGTYSRGLDRLDTRSGRFHHYNSSGSGLPDISVYALLKDSEGRIWAGTPRGACIYQPDKDCFVPVEETADADIRCIVEDAYGYIWLASCNRGIIKYDPVNGRWSRYSKEAEGRQNIKTDLISTLYSDSSGKLIAGTDGYGIALYDYITASFEFLDLPLLSGTTVNSIENSGNLTWISTNAGLLRVNLRSGDCKMFTTEDGLQSIQFCPNSSLKAADGTLWFGGINGMNSFRPENLHENTSVPGVYITGMSLFNKRLRCMDESGVLDKAISYKQDIVLRHDQSVISLDFVSLSYISPKKNSYAYKLEGFDRQWTSISTVPFGGVTYTNLPAGDYVFMVRGSNNDQLWNNTGTSLRIKVLPPWWQTPLAYAIYIFLALSFVVLVIRHYVKKIERRHEDSIRELNARKEKDIYDIKINFYTSIIHELRTPLTLIISPLEHVMKSNKRVSEVKDDLLIIERNSNRLLSLVNQLMDFRKMESRSGSLPQASSVDVPVFCRQVFDGFVPAAREKRIELEFESNPLSLWMESNSDSLSKLVSNLMSNALKFARSRVKLSLKRNGDILSISCDDDGPGVPVEERDKIFTAFYQVESMQPADGIGTGVGLSLVKSLIAQMGGEVSVSESDMGGARFVLALPVKETEAVVASADEDISRSPLTDEENEEQEGQSAKILFVDDNKDMLSFLRGQFSAIWQVSSCDNAASALELCREKEFDIIVCDVMMPGMDGTEFCRKIKSDIDTCHIPVILLTAKVDTASKIKGLDSGADAYVEKPFSIDFLKAQIQSLLVNRRKVYDVFAKEPVVNVASLVTNKQDLEFLKKVDEFIEINLNESSFTASDIARHVGMSRSAFFSKLRAVSGQTPSDYVRLIRLRKAVEYFNQGETRINEVCYITGFNSPSYFTKCFVRQFGMIPKDYIKKIHSEESRAAQDAE
ncbi:MAG: two-component regulator propeller domain-containing protein [Candidatus Cryptobacteroides sp.]